MKGLPHDARARRIGSCLGKYGRLGDAPPRVPLTVREHQHGELLRRELVQPATQHPAYVTLAYGKTWRQKMFGCTSHVNGVNCSNPSGHGIFISRQTWRTW